MNTVIYLDNSFLTEGADTNSHSNIVKQFAMFSEHFTAERLTNIAVQRIFRAEVLGLCRSGVFMGIWQIAALASILERDVLSVYPLYGGKTVRSDLNRRFIPYHRNSLEGIGNLIYIMWTNIITNTPEKDWRPNHVVPLLKTCSYVNIQQDDDISDQNSQDDEILDQNSQQDAEIEDYIDDDTFFSLDSSLLNNIIQTLDESEEVCLSTFESLEDGLATEDDIRWKKTR